MTSTLVPATTVRLDIAGVPLPTDLLAAVSTVEVEQRLGRPSQLRATLAGQRLGGTDALLRAGTRLRATVDGHDVDLFDGELSGVQRTWTVDGGQRLIVRAVDGLRRAHRARRCVSFEGDDPISITRRICADHGLSLQTDRALPDVDVIHQLAETDLDFVTRILRPHGLRVALYADRPSMSHPDRESGRRSRCSQAVSCTNCRSTADSTTPRRPASSGGDRTPRPASTKPTAAPTEAGRSTPPKPGPSPHR